MADEDPDTQWLPLTPADELADRVDDLISRIVAGVVSTPDALNELQSIANDLRGTSSRSFGNWDSPEHTWYGGLLLGELMRHHVDVASVADDHGDYLPYLDIRVFDRTIRVRVQPP